jgi:ribosome-associated protein
LVTKKRSDGEGGRPVAARKTTKKSAVAGGVRKAPSRKTAAVDADETTSERPARPTSRSTVKAAAKKAPARPRLRASHATAEVVGKRGEGAAKKPAKAAAAKASKKLPLAAPKRAAARKPEPAVETAAAARELSLAIASEGLEKKALGVEILDVRGRIDYADFLVIMTGRSDRHVHAIATGIEEALGRKRKTSPISVEGLTAANWVLLDYGDVVVHVFQEEARQLYDIEGLWMDASRVAVPQAPAEGQGARAPASFADPGEVEGDEAE